MAELLAEVDLQKRDGSRKKGKDALQDFYEELHGQNFEIVFVSSDESEEELKEYLEESHGDWYHIPFGQSAIQLVEKMYDIKSIPRLVIIKPNGDVITDNGRNEIQGKVSQLTLAAWKAA